MKNFKGIIYAALSSSTFGLAPLFSILLLSDGFSSFEVLSYRWGVASLTLGIIGLAGGCRFRISRQELCTVFFLSLFRAATSLSLVIAYQNISSGVASIIHFMYPLAVALAMALFFRERISWRTAAAIGVSLAGVYCHNRPVRRNLHRQTRFTQRNRLRLEADIHFNCRHFRFFLRERKGSAAHHERHQESKEFLHICFRPFISSMIRLISFHIKQPHLVTFIVPDASRFCNTLSRRKTVDSRGFGISE